MNSQDAQDTVIAGPIKVEQVNGQPVRKDIVRLATSDESVDTAVISFFDVDYIRTEDDQNDAAAKSRKRTVNRTTKTTNRFIR